MKKRWKVLHLLAERDGWICGREDSPKPGCGRRLSPPEATVDHVIPKARLGGGRLENLQILCRKCNEMYGDAFVVPEGKELRGGILVDVGSGDPRGRSLWRTLVRVDEVDGDTVQVVVPAWNVRRRVEMRVEDLPAEIAERLRPDRRFHAMANLDAERPEDLRFEDWETR